MTEQVRPLPGPRLRRVLALADLDVPDARSTTSHDRVVDALLVLFSLAGGVLVWGSAADGLEPMSPRTGLFFLMDAAAGLLLCAAVPLRRRFPVPLAVVASTVLCWSAAGVVAGSVLVWGAVVRRRLSTTLLLLPVLLVPAFVYPLAHPSPDLAYGPDALLGVVLALLLVCSALYVRVRRQLTALLAERERRALEEREQQVVQARRQERARIAHEMHDVLAHRLSLVSLQAGALEYRPDAAPEDLARAAGVVRATAQGALEDLRTVIGLLREDDDSVTDRPQPTWADVGALVEEARSAGQRVRVDGEAAAPWTGLRVPDGIGRTAYRVVQEGLTNARKHAPGTVVHVRVGGRPGGRLGVELENPLALDVGDGALRRQADGTGTGLVGLTERVEQAGGALQHGATPDGRFRLVAHLPWPA